MNAMCPHCEKITDIDIFNAPEEYEIKGVKVTINAEHSLCHECGQEFATHEQMEKASRTGLDAYRKIADIITPAEILRIREKYGASQKVMAKILDLGELTINSYEQGALVSKSISNLIRLMDSPENFTDLFNKKRADLSRTQLRRIETALEHQRISLKENLSLSLYDHLENIKNLEEKYTGYNHPDVEKLLYLIQFVLHVAQKELYTMAIFKILFYIDFTAFKMTTLSITGWPYARLPYGPVPNEYKDVLRAGEDNEYFSSHPDANEVGELFGLPESFDQKTLHPFFDEGSQKIIKMVVSTLKDKTPGELRDLTHREKAWIETPPAALIDYSWANELILF